MRAVLCAAALVGIIACGNMPLRMSVVRKPCADGSSNASVRREVVIMVENTDDEGKINEHLFSHF